MSLPEIWFESASEETGRDGLGATSVEYGVTPESFSYEAETRYEPAGGEVEAPNFVALYANGVHVGDVPYAVFILDYASYNHVTLRVAEGKVDAELYQTCYEHEADRYDDSYPY